MIEVYRTQIDAHYSQNRQSPLTLPVKYKTRQENPQTVTRKVTSLLNFEVLR